VENIIGELESEFDQRYLSFKLPDVNRHRALWFVISVSEDLILNVWRKSRNPMQITIMADKFKYSIKHAFNRMHKETVDESEVVLPTYLGRLPYTASTDLLNAGVDYASATQICIFAHKGISRLTRDDGVVKIDSGDLWRNAGYSALEMIELEPSAQVEFLIKILNLAANPNLHSLYKTVSEQTTVSGDGYVSYAYSYQNAKLFSSFVPFLPSIFPDEWIFPWGAGDETRKLSWALTVRCAYHIFSIRSGASKYSVTGGGLESISLVILKDDFICQLAELAEVGPIVSKKFVEALIFGRKTKNADPALQPIFPLHEDGLIIGCLNILSNRQDRNLLSLHARIESKLFDKQSGVFEEKMIFDIEKIAIQRKFNFRKNVHIPSAHEAGDIDLIFCDERSKTMLTCELRWLLQPGDPVEIINKAEACIQKVGKIKTKVKALQGNVKEFAHVVFDKNINADEWRVVGVIVIDGYGGVESSDETFPIITKKVFLEGLKRFSKISEFYDWMSSLKWLPKQDLHYKTDTIKDDVINLRTERPGFAILPEGSNYLGYVQATIKKYRQK